jgi:hypothetical protein
MSKSPHAAYDFGSKGAPCARYRHVSETDLVILFY